MSDERLALEIHSYLGMLRAFKPFRAHEEIRQIGSDIVSHLLLTKIHLGSCSCSKSASISCCSGVRRLHNEKNRHVFPGLRGLEASWARSTSRLGSADGREQRSSAGSSSKRGPAYGPAGSRVGTVCRAQTRPYTEIVKQNLSLICKCQQQYKRWSDDD